MWTTRSASTNQGSISFSVPIGSTIGLGECAPRTGRNWLIRQWQCAETPAKMSAAVRERSRRVGRGRGALLAGFPSGGASRVVIGGNVKCCHIWRFGSPEQRKPCPGTQARRTHASNFLLRIGLLAFLAQQHRLKISMISTAIIQSFLWRLVAGGWPRRQEPLFSDDQVTPSLHRQTTSVLLSVYDDTGYRRDRH